MWNEGTVTFLHWGQGTTRVPLTSTWYTLGAMDCSPSFNEHLGTRTQPDTYPSPMPRSAPYGGRKNKTKLGRDTKIKKAKAQAEKKKKPIKCGRMPICSGMSCIRLTAAGKTKGYATRPKASDCAKAGITRAWYAGRLHKLAWVENKFGTVYPRWVEA